MPDTRYSLHESVSLLALREEGERVVFLGSEQLCRAWAAACLAELSLSGAVGIGDHGRVKAKAGKRADADDSANSVWTDLSVSDHPRKLRAWIKRIGERVSEKRMIACFAQSGLVDDDRGKYRMMGDSPFLYEKISLREALRAAVFALEPSYPGGRILLLLAVLRKYRMLKLAFTRDERACAGTIIVAMMKDVNNAAAFAREFGEDAAFAMALMGMDAP